MAAVHNASSFTSPLADASYRSVSEGGVLSDVLSTVQGLSAWTIALTILLLLVGYDQVNYILQKGSIAGPAFKIPFIGPFLESVYVLLSTEELSHDGSLLTLS